jgi:hypothetical protein
MHVQYNEVKLVSIYFEFVIIIDDLFLKYIKHVNINFSKYKFKFND